MFCLMAVSLVHAYQSQHKSILATVNLLNEPNSYACCSDCIIKTSGSTWTCSQWHISCTQWQIGEINTFPGYNMWLNCCMRLQHLADSAQDTAHCAITSRCNFMSVKTQRTSVIRGKKTLICLFCMTEFWFYMTWQADACQTNSTSISLLGKRITLDDPYAKDWQLQVKKAFSVSALRIRPRRMQLTDCTAPRKLVKQPLTKAKTWEAAGTRQTIKWRGEETE